MILIDVELSWRLLAIGRPRIAGVMRRLAARVIEPFKGAAALKGPFGLQRLSILILRSALGVIIIITAGPLPDPVTVGVTTVAPAVIAVAARSVGAMFAGPPGLVKAVTGASMSAVEAGPVIIAGPPGLVKAAARGPAVSTARGAAMPTAAGPGFGR